MFTLSNVTVRMFFNSFRGLFSTSSGYVLCNGMCEEICKLHGTCEGRAADLNTAVFYAVTAQPWATAVKSVFCLELGHGYEFHLSFLPSVGSYHVCSKRSSFLRTTLQALRT